MVTIAAIQPRLLKVGDLRSTTVGAAYLTIRPADGDHEHAAILVLGEELDSLLESLWAFHVLKVAH